MALIVHNDTSLIQTLATESIAHFLNIFLPEHCRQMHITVESFFEAH